MSDFFVCFLFHELASLHCSVVLFMRNGSETADSVYFLSNQMVWFSFAESAALLLGLFVWATQVPRFVVAENVVSPSLFVYVSTVGGATGLSGWSVLVCFTPHFGGFSFWCAFHYLSFIPPGGSCI